MWNYISIRIGNEFFSNTSVCYGCNELMVTNEPEGEKVPLSGSGELRVS